MRILGKMFFIAALAVCAASCLKDGNVYSGTYSIATTFETGRVIGTDSLYFEGQQGYGIGWQDLVFGHKLTEDKSKHQGGFMVSWLKGNGPAVNDRFRVNSGIGHDSTATYIVYYSNPDETLMPERDVEFIMNSYGSCTMVGCFVNNTKEVAAFVRENFVPGDNLSIRMTGYLDGKKTDECSFVLAEKSEIKDSLVTSWRAFDLSKLQDIEYIDIAVESNRTDVPKAFCLDDMIAKIAIAY